MERGTGIEPATSSLGSWHSTAEFPPLLTAFTSTLPRPDASLQRARLHGRAGRPGRETRSHESVSVIIYVGLFFCCEAVAQQKATFNSGPMDYLWLMACGA